MKFISEDNKIFEDFHKVYNDISFDLVLNTDLQGVEYMKEFFKRIQEKGFIIQRISE